MIELIQHELKILKGGPQNLLFEGASPEDIEGVERQIGIPLPRTFKYFLQATNGAVLYQTETIFGTKDGRDQQVGFQVSIVEVKRAMHLPNHLIPFYQSNEVHFFDSSRGENGEYPVVAWDEKLNQTENVAQNFVEWLTRYIIGEFEAV